MHHSSKKSACRQNCPGEIHAVKHAVLRAVLGKPVLHVHVGNFDHHTVKHERNTLGESWLTSGRAS
jgi:hypothetical protein